jgi:14-3-3 protein epsilon
MASQRDIDVSLIQLLNQTDRHEDMVDLVKRVIDADPILDAGQRDLLSLAYKSVITNRRNGLRYINALLDREEAKASEFRLEQITILRSTILSELETYALELIHLIDEKLLPATVKPEVQVYYQKMKGDYWRYIAEGKDGTEKEEAANQAKEAYEKALKIAQEHIPLATPIHLGVILNYSVYLCEITGEKQEAIEFAQKTFDEASIIVSKNEGASDVTNLLQLLRDNILLWRGKPE